MKLRVYPTCCTSAYCGKIECPDDCRNLPTRLEFEAWRERTEAVCTDPIWCPNVYEASKKER